MTKFIAYVEQKAEGCDYSIACGYDLWELKAENLKDALAECKNAVVGDWDDEDECFEEGYNGDDQLESVTLYEVANTMELPIDNWYAAANTRVEAAKRSTNKATEISELKRLKAKYE